MKNFTIVILLLISTKLSAQTATEGAVTVEKKSFRIESITFLNFDHLSKQRQWDLNELFRLGLSKRIELRLANNYLVNRNFNNTENENVSGFGDINAGYKVQLYRSKTSGKFDFAFMGTYSFPTGGDEFSTNSFFSNHLFLFSNAINDNMGIEYNIGYQNGDDRGDVIYTFSFGSTIIKDFGGFIEYYGSLVNLNRAEHNIDFGFNYSIKDNFQVDATFGLPLVKKPANSYVSVGIYYQFGKSQ